MAVTPPTTTSPRRSSTCCSRSSRASRADRVPPTSLDRRVKVGSAGASARPIETAEGDTMKAPVLTAYDTPLETRDDIEIAPPGPGEVRVKVVASGVCHSDLSVQNGTIPLPTPIVLGHEGAGIIEEVGEGVSRVAPGDHVVLSFV